MRRKAAATRRPKGASSSRPLGRENKPDISWIEALAAPYLRGYLASQVSSGPLHGYRFTAPAHPNGQSKAGFFVGYILKPGNLAFLNVSPPECVVFVFIEPVDSAFHREFVAQEGSLLRKTAEYIGWLTHRPPRFAFFDDEEAPLARHFSMNAWPKSKHQHYSRNFFIETLAWLVRSGLVAKLRGSESPSGDPDR